MQTRNIAYGSIIGLILSALLAPALWAQQAIPTVSPARWGKLTSQSHFISALEVGNGAVVPSGSRKGVTVKGATNIMASGVKIAVKQDQFNGVYVHGKNSSYTLKNSTITLTGRGTNDFDAVAAGALVSQAGTLILRNVTITTNGATSDAVTATEGSTLKVYHSTLIANGGSLPSGYVRHVGLDMMEPPIFLSITGTARASLTMNNSSSYFYDSTIISQGWGALSTDNANGHVYLEANNCDVRTIKSGYGAYADTNAEVVLNNSRVTVASYVGIISRNGKMRLNALTAQSDYYGVLIHTVAGRVDEAAQLQIIGGSLSSPDATVLVRSANADIVFDHAKLLPANGDLILSVVNDDFFATKMNGKKVHGIVATLKDENLTGNLVHLDAEHPMAANLVHSTLKGVIKDVNLSLDGQSKWIATADSKVTLVGKIAVTSIDAPAGITITARAGQGCLLHGRYKLAGGGVLNVI